MDSAVRRERTIHALFQQSGVTAALVSCGTVVVQNSLAGSAFGLQFRPAQQKSKGSSQPATAAAAAAGSLALEANLAEAALVTSKACSPPKTRGVTRSLAPAVSIAARKSKRRRGRPNGGSGDGGKGGGDGSDSWWWEPEDDEGPQRRITEGLWLWQALCWLSLIQAVVCAVAAAARSQPCRSGLLACASASINHERSVHSPAMQSASAAA
ncbi:hypothetical protein WJX74_005226 [Apatococcus lobatus]|uniref:Uncharacterized protein n=1 Tax=Apatococcus lobatus TaxID=904363 RepID=A0AAW1SEG1_9CHLO